MNYENGWINYWDLYIFEERLELMREALDNFFNFNKAIEEGEEDPFWDPKQLILYARGVCLVKNSLYRFSLEQKVSLLGSDGHIGFLKVVLSPIDDQQ